MSHETRVYSTIAVKLFFEGENHQSFVDVFAQQSYPPLPPRPELRANVVHDRNPALVHLASNPPVERRRINDDGEIRSTLIRFGDQLVKQAIDLRQMADNFGNADDRKVFRIDDNVAPSSPHALPASTKKFNIKLRMESRPGLSSRAK